MTHPACRTLVASLAPLLLLPACAGDEFMEAGHSSSALTERSVVGVAVSTGGGLCFLTSGDCWSEAAVFDDGRVVLSDVEGTMESTLSEAELAELLELLRAPIFVELVSAESIRCPFAFDFDGDFRIEWSDGSSHVFEGARTCVDGDLERSGLVLSRLGWFLQRTRDLHRTCTEFNPNMGSVEPWDGRHLCL